jgi:hypothetical protein
MEVNCGGVRLLFSEDLLNWSNLIRSHALAFSSIALSVLCMYCSGTASDPSATGCVAMGNVGDPCTEDVECVTDVCAAGVCGTAPQVIVVGGACQLSAACIGKASCVEGICVAGCSGEGNECETSKDCCDGTCTDNVCSGSGGCHQ